MRTAISDILALKGPDLFTVPPEAPVASAVRLMNERNIGAVAVVEDDHLRGIFSERDVLRRVVGPARDPQTTLVSEVMTSDVVFIRERTTLGEAMAIMNSKGIRHLPVIGADDQLLAIVSVRDLINQVVDGQEHQISELVEYIAGSYGRQPDLTV